jgi:hypothetical protein
MKESYAMIGLDGKKRFEFDSPVETSVISGKLGYFWRGCGHGKPER